MDTVKILVLWTIGLSVCLHAKGKRCEHRFLSSQGLSGSFHSPGYPASYPARVHCTYIFQGTMDERINITFIDFVLQRGTAAGCLFDYIDIFTIDLFSMKQFENRFCGNSIKKTFISVENRLELVFKSDYSISHKGFLGHYQFVDEYWQPFPESDPQCGSAILTGVGGVITSPGYPEPYRPRIQCTWMIKTEREKKLLLNFLVLDLGQNVDCSHTSVSLYNWFAKPSSVPADRLCGQLAFYDRGLKEFKSNTFRVIVRFVSGRSNEDGAHGFRLAWTAVKLPKDVIDQHGVLREEPCFQFHCKGGEYCIDTSGLLCNPLQRYCIDESLRCNDVPNCGASDKSDEEGCLKYIIMIVMAVLGPSFVIIVIATLVVRKHRSHKNLTVATKKKKKKPKSKDEREKMQVEKLQYSPSLLRKSMDSLDWDDSCGQLNGKYAYLDSAMRKKELNRDQDRENFPYFYEEVVKQYPSYYSPDKSDIPLSSSPCKAYPRYANMPRKAPCVTFTTAVSPKSDCPIEQEDQTGLTSDYNHPRANGCGQGSPASIRSNRSFTNYEMLVNANSISATV